jgi:hypothetical protein
MMDWRMDSKLDDSDEYPPRAQSEIDSWGYHK